MTREQLERLASARINLLPAIDLSRHFVFERDGFVSLVERDGEETGAIGCPGLLTGKGYAALMWRSGKPWFVAKGFEQPAEAGQVDAIRRFQTDLDTALKK